MLEGWPRLKVDWHQSVDVRVALDHPAPSSLLTPPSPRPPELHALGAAVAGCLPRLLPSMHVYVLMLEFPILQ